MAWSGACLCGKTQPFLEIPAGNEGMKKMMKSTIAGYMSSYLIHS